MTPEPPRDLQQLFADSEEPLPAEEFTAGVMDGLRRSSRREHWIAISSAVAAFAFACFAFSNLEPVLGRLSVEPGALLGVARQAWTAVSQSPLVYVYGTALGGHLLVKLVRRLEIRWF